MSRWSTEAAFQYIEDAPPEGVPLKEDGAVVACHTPGHTPGSLSVCIRADQGKVWLCGDSSFDLPGLQESATLAGIHFWPHAVRKEHERLRRELAAGALILPSHDWTAAERARAFVK